MTSWLMVQLFRIGLVPQVLFSSNTALNAILLRDMAQQLPDDIMANGQSIPTKLGAPGCPGIAREVFRVK